MKSLTLLYFWLIAACVFGQEPSFHVFKISTQDATTLRAIQNVQIRFQCDNQSGIQETDALGMAYVNCSQNNLKISVQGEFYNPQNGLRLKAEQAFEKNGDTLVFRILMEPKSAKTTKEIIITNPYKPNAIFASERLSVADFEILDNNELLLLTYERTLNKGAELLRIDENEKVLFSKSIGSDAKHLFTDFRGFIHVMYENKLDYVYLEEDALDLIPMEKQYYKRFIAPIIDTNKTKFYFTNYRETYPAADFFVYDELDSTYFKISRVADEIMMDMYIKEYLWVDTRTKLWAREMALLTGMDKEDIVGEAIFTQSIFYKEIYAPMFLKNDTLYLFDFYKDLMFRYTKAGTSIDSMAISIHLLPKKTGWCNRLIQDPVTGCIYAIFEKGGYTTIRPINLNNASLDLTFRLDFKYVEKLVIHDNAVYYTYRPFESKQKKFLYKQQLPLYFDKNVTARDGRKDPE